MSVLVLVSDHGSEDQAQPVRQGVSGRQGQVSARARQIPSHQGLDPRPRCQSRILLDCIGPTGCPVAQAPVKKKLCPFPQRPYQVQGKRWPVAPVETLSPPHTHTSET